MFLIILLPALWRYQSATLRHVHNTGGHICLLIHKGPEMRSRSAIQRYEATPCGEGVLGLKSRASARSTSKSGHGEEVNPGSPLTLRASTPSPVRLPWPWAISLFINRVFLSCPATLMGINDLPLFIRLTGVGHCLTRVPRVKEKSKRVFVSFTYHARYLVINQFVYSRVRCFVFVFVFFNHARQFNC